MSYVATLILLLFPILACQPDPALQGPVAQVDGIEIPRAALARAVERRVSFEPDRPRSDILLEELDGLISEQVVLNRADALGVRIRDPEVDERLRILFAGDLSQNTPEFTTHVHRQMLIERTTLLELAGRLHIPEYAIAAYFEENREAFRTPPRIQIRHILLQDPTRAHEISTRLRAGADFEALAREASVAPEADTGGLLPPFAAGDMPEAFDRAFELPVGGLSEVIESPFGYHLFRVERQLPAQGAVLENAHDEIRRLLEQRRLEELRRNWLRRLRRTAMINVNEPLLETLR